MKKLPLSCIFTKKELKECAKFLAKYFKETQTRIYELLLQLESLDDSLTALMYARDNDIPLNEVIYNILLYRDNCKDE